MTVSRILHISDLHFTTRASGKQQILNAPFLADLRRVFMTSGRPDFIVFSGDLVNNPDEADVYIGLAEFIDDLVSACGLTYDKVIVCPGNHDVSRSSQKRNRLKYDWIHDHVNDQQAIDDAYLAGHFDDYLREQNKGFFEFSDLLGVPWSEPLFHVYRFPQSSVTFVCINSTLACSLDGSAQDQGRLIYPQPAIEKALSLASAGTTICVMHHGLSQFAENSSKPLSRLITQNTSALLFGHVHDPKPTVEFGPDNALLQMQSGALYERAGAFNGYALAAIELPGHHRRLVYRTYFDSRGSFDEAVNVAQHGIFTFPDDAAFWDLHRAPLDAAALRSWLQPVAQRIRDEHGIGFDGKPAFDRYVFPPLNRAKQDSSDPSPSRVDKPDEQWSADHVLTTPDNILIFVPGEFGATSLLAWLAVEECTIRDGRIASIPLFVDIRSAATRPYISAATATLRAAHPDIAHDVFGWQSLIAHQPYTVYVDNYDPFDEKHQKTLALFSQVLPKSRFIIAAKTLLAAQGRITATLPLPFGYVALSMAPFKRARVRSLVRKWALPQHFGESAVVEEIITRFAMLNIPLTGPHISIYLTVLCEQNRFSPLNAASVLESFVETILEKPSAVNLFRSSVDYRERVEFLSVIAERMCRDNSTYSYKLEEIYEIGRDHYRRIGIDRDVMKLIQEMKEYRIFEDSANNITFKYNVLLSFFVATRMSLDKDFRDFVLDRSRFGTYVHEIDIYCGLVRNDKEIIEIISDHYRSAVSELGTVLSDLFDQTLLERITLPKVKDVNHFVDAVSKELDRDDGEGERDRALEAADMTPPDFRQRFQRRHVQDRMYAWVLALRAYSVCLKNLESIDHTAKERHLTAVLDGWSGGVTLAVMLIAAVFSDGQIELGGVKVRFNGKRVFDGATLRRLLVALPMLVSSFLRADLGTAKLTKQLREMDPSGRPVSDLFRTGLLADLKVDAFLKVVRSFIKDHKKSSFLMESLMVKMRDVFLRYGFTDSESNEFRRIIAELDADLRGVTGAQRERDIARGAQALMKSKTITRSTGS